MRLTQGTVLQRVAGGGDHGSVHVLTYRWLVHRRSANQRTIDQTHRYTQRTDLAQLSDQPSSWATAHQPIVVA